MVKIGLQIKATMENVTEITADGTDFRWYFRLRCVNCGELPDHVQYISLEEVNQLKGSRGEASCIIKCKFCARDNSINIIEDSIVSYNFEDSEKFKTIVIFDCRGLEPASFSPRNGWTVYGYKPSEEEGEVGSKTGSVFFDVDLSSDWADYDEQSSLPTVISDIESNFIKVK